MDAIDTQLTQVTEEIDALKKERTEAKKELERAIKAYTSERVMASLQSLLDAATAELKRLGEKEVQLMRQKDRLTAATELSYSAVPRERFLKSLSEAGISTSKPAVNKIVDTIARRFPNHMLAVAGSPDACYELYKEVKELPATFTRGIIQDKLNVSINGPMPGQKSILTAIDLEAGKRCVFKLLSPPQLVASAPPSVLAESVSMEVEVSTIVSKAEIPRLVTSEVVTVSVKHSDGLSVSARPWTALKMRHYHSSLTQVPQLSERLIHREFGRIYSALVSLHALNLVHMDVKSDNVFVDEDVFWNLGDFGSCRRTNSPSWTFTEVFNPYAIVQFKTSVIPAMDMVLLCVMIGVELEKETWKVRLCGKTQRVQHEFIKKSLSEIQEAAFRDEIMRVYEESYAKVIDHLNEFV
ncbi:hypothetical protein BJ741DRAFT_672909 [Chytriomyces cf. hyalinus JEL632]|nr:hypothetical protein BJ741DRAFT_672909 [Chytriomyces cf. hyalinus JEL632]